MPRHRRHTLIVAIVVVAVGALVLRTVGLADRPMHGDEAVHAAKFEILWNTGRYEYDPHEYHGPTIYYAALPIAWLTGVRAFADTTEWTYRLVPVILGVGLILLLPLLADGLGRPAVIAAAALTAVSPAFVYYSRYYIQEVPLVFFTLLAIASAWRYFRSGRAAWLLCVGFAVGLMHATKETCTIAWGAAGLAALLSLCWTHPRRAGRIVQRRMPPAWLTLAALIAVLTSVLFMTGLFSNWRGAADSILTYATYYGRAGGDGEHAHPIGFYWRRLLYFHDAPGPWSSEAPILLLALVGTLSICRGARSPTRDGAGVSPATAVSEIADGGRDAAPLGDARPLPRLAGSPGLRRFILLYALILAALYTALPYKTPWSMLGFLHGLILLAGVGAAALWNWTRPLPARALALLLFAAALTQLGTTAWTASHKFAADARNPYAYAHPLRQVITLADALERYADAASAADGPPIIQVITPDPWPLPWYLRRYGRVGYWEAPPDELVGAILVVDVGQAAVIADRLAADYVAASSYAVRPRHRVQVYVGKALWATFLAEQGAGA